MSPWDKNHTQLRINELASIRGNIETKNSPIRWGRQDTRKFFFILTYPIWVSLSMQLFFLLIFGP